MPFNGNKGGCYRAAGLLNMMPAACLMQKVTYRCYQVECSLLKLFAG